MDLICNKTLLAQEVHPLKKIPCSAYPVMHEDIAAQFIKNTHNQTKNPQVIKYSSSKPKVVNSSQNPKVANSSSNPPNHEILLPPSHKPFLKPT